MPKLLTKELERYYFEMFKKDYDLPSGNVIYGDKPDVILEGERRIGIEITNFYLKSGHLPESEQVQVRAREDVVARAHWLYINDNGRKIELTFWFNKIHHIRDQKKLVRSIVALAKRIERNVTGPVNAEIFENMPELSSIYLNAEEYDDAIWRIAQVHSVPNMSLSDLRAIIQEKEIKARKYQTCEAFWLLIVIDFIDRAQEQEVQIRDLENVKSNVFENILIFKPHLGINLEIRQKL